MKYANNFIYKIVYILTISTLFIACSSKINVKAIKASKINDNSVRNITVTNFQNDTIYQSEQIDSALGNVIIDGKKYFTLIDRKNINIILKEKELNDSGLVDFVNQNQEEGLKEVKSILTGKVILNDLSSSSYYENRTNYNKCIKSYHKNGKKYCSKYFKYTVSCKANLYSVKTKIKILKVSNSKIIFTNTYLKSKKYTHCMDDKNILPSKNKINTKLANLISSDIIHDIAPSYINFKVKLLDSIDIDITSNQKNKFKIAIKMIELNRIKKANKILKDLNTQLNSKSVVILYDLAITYESLGNLNIAYNLLKRAEDIAISKSNVIEEISIAIKRIETNIKEKHKAKEQM